MTYGCPEAVAMLFPPVIDDLERRYPGVVVYNT
jgi:hypothetical protein